MKPQLKPRLSAVEYLKEFEALEREIAEFESRLKNRKFDLNHDLAFGAKRMTLRHQEAINERTSAALNLARAILESRKSEPAVAVVRIPSVRVIAGSEGPPHANLTAYPAHAPVSET